VIDLHGKFDHLDSNLSTAYRCIGASSHRYPEMKYEENEALIEWVRKLIQMGRSISEIVSAIRVKENCSESEAMDIHAIASERKELREFHEELESLIIEEMQREGAVVTESDDKVEITINLSELSGDNQSDQDNPITRP
tara:strand:+ start:926 stop:1342 length:417 start_codon:yes stop_codon:yes gene_type:complete